MKPKLNLIRIVKTPQDAVLVDDIKGKLPGRGTYVCTDAICIDKISKSKSYERVFGVKLDIETLSLLHKELHKRIEHNG